MPTDQVELFIMRALSLGLIKGSMDQVDGTVDVTWAMPRVLDKVQMGALAGRFGEWAVKVSKTSDYMGERVPTFGCGDGVYLSYWRIRCIPYGFTLLFRH